MLNMRLHRDKSEKCLPKGFKPKVLTTIIGSRGHFLAPGDPELENPVEPPRKSNRNQLLDKK